MENKNTNVDILNDLFLFEENTQNQEITSTQEEKVEDIFLELKSEEIISEELDVLSEISNQQEKEDVILNNEIQISTSEKKVWFFSKFIWNFVFLAKYIWTSTLIFVLLLSASNYSAYIEIARSYLNPEALEQNRNAMLASVNSTNLIKQNSQTGEILDTIPETNLDQKINLVENKTYHSMDKLINTTNDENLNMQIDIVPYENRVIIPKIGKNIPLIEVENKTVQNVKELEDVFMKELVNWIVRYPGSAKPGDIWNSFIFWHSSNFPWLEWKYNDVFALLDKLEFWDEIIVYYWQKKYTYKIREKNVIKPGDVSVLKRNTGKAEISLMTCWPVWTTLNRMIVVWELIEE